MPASVTNEPIDPNFAPILDLLQAFRRSKVMFAAVSLGIFDVLITEALSSADLATKLAVDADALERLLDSCVGLGLLRRTERTYECTVAAATYLCHQSPQRVTGYIEYSNNVMWKLWAHLEDAVREGSHRWPQVYGWDGPIFQNFFRTEEAKREFLWGMHGFGIVSSPHVVTAFDLRRFTRLVDLGGATGHLLVSACERYSTLNGVLFDLEDAIPLARNTLAAHESPIESHSPPAISLRMRFLPPTFMRWVEFSMTGRKQKS